MRDSHIQILLWALPIAMSIHVVEEFAYPGGYIRWIKSHKLGRLKSNLYYVALNAAAILGGTIIALKASDIVGYCIFLYSVAIVAGNATSHLVGSLQKRQYCPGSVSGAVLLLPLLVVSTWSFHSKGIVDLPLAVVCICIGFFIGFYVFSTHIRRKDRI